MNKLLTIKFTNKKKVILLIILILIFFIFAEVLTRIVITKTHLKNNVAKVRLSSLYIKSDNLILGYEPAETHPIYDNISGLVKYDLKKHMQTGKKAEATSTFY